MAEARQAPATTAGEAPVSAAAVSSVPTGAAAAAAEAAAEAALSAKFGWHVGRGRRDGHQDASAIGSQKSDAGASASASAACRQRQWSRSGSMSGRQEGEGERDADINADADAEGEADTDAGGDADTSSAGHAAQEGHEAQDGAEAHDGHGSREGQTSAASVLVGVWVDVLVGVGEWDAEEVFVDVGVREGCFEELIKVTLELFEVASEGRSVIVAAGGGPDVVAEGVRVGDEVGLFVRDAEDVREGCFEGLIKVTLELFEVASEGRSVIVAADGGPVVVAEGVRVRDEVGLLVRDAEDVTEGCIEGLIKVPLELFEVALEGRSVIVAASGRSDTVAEAEASVGNGGVIVAASGRSDTVAEAEASVGNGASDTVAEAEASEGSGGVTEAAGGTSVTVAEPVAVGELAGDTVNEATDAAG